MGQCGVDLEMGGLGERIPSVASLGSLFVTTGTSQLLETPVYAVPIIIVFALMSCSDEL